jgi:hypothetical protein
MHKAAAMSRIPIPEVLRPEKNRKHWTFCGPDKVPHDIKGGYAKCNDPTTWECGDAVEAAIGANPIAVPMFAITDGYIAIDLDDPKGDQRIIEFHKWVLSLFPNTYAETSVSTRGIHILLKGVLNIPRSGLRIPNLKLEIYHRSRFMTVSGNTINNVPIVDCQLALNNLLRWINDNVRTIYKPDCSHTEKPRHTPSDGPQTPSEHRDKTTSVDPDIGIANLPQIRSDSEVWNAAAAAENGDLFLLLWSGEYEGILNQEGNKRYGTHSESVLGLFNFLAFHTFGCVEQMTRMFFQSALSKKLKPHHQRRDWIERTIVKALDRTFPQWQLNIPDLNSAADDQILPPEPMSEKAFIGLAADVVRAIEVRSEADRQGLLVSLLAEFGCVAGRRPCFRTDGKYQRAKLSPVLIGESGNSRKGTATANINALMKDVDPKFWKDHRASGLSTGEGLVQRIRDVTTLEQSRTSDCWSSKKNLAAFWLTPNAKAIPYRSSCA